MPRSPLRSLSDKELLAQIQTLRHREHLSTLEILLHLNEVERRRLHLRLGYGSLFDYCIKHLTYSASAAGRRIQAARCVRRFPEAFGLLKKNRVNLMTLSAMAPILTEENHSAMLARICDKTQREAEAIASQYRPPISMRDRVRPVRVRVSELNPSKGAQASLASLKPEGENRTSMSDYSQTGSDIMLTNSKNGKNRSSNGGPNVRTRQKLLVQFLANKEFMERFEEVRALLSQRLSSTSFENVFEALMNEFLQRHSPSSRKARRDNKRTENQKTSPASRQPLALNKAKPQSRRIPAAVWDAVFARDKGRCTYVGETGRRCGSKQALQVDHIKPFARGGANAASNLRLLCAKHNRLAAQEVFGENFMQRFRPRE
jgi:5-methylcytosine-specific restriction endonuclease McrA